MFSFKYNLLALVQVVVTVFNYLIFIKIYGVTKFTDAYFLVISIISAINIIQLQFNEQFIVFYNDEKKISNRNAYEFYQASLFLSFLVGCFTFIICYLGDEIIFLFFANNFDENRNILLKEYFYIAIIELVFLPVLLVNQKILNAEMKFALPYFLILFPHVLLLFMMIYIGISGNVSDVANKSLKLLIYTKIIGVLFSTLWSFYFIIRTDVKLGLRFFHPKLKEFVRNSFAIRFGHNIHNFLFLPITTNLLSTLPNGYVSYFFYAHKMASIIFSVSAGPSLNILNSKLSSAWSKTQYRLCKSYMSSYNKVVIPSFIILSILAYHIIPYVFPIIDTPLDLEAIELIQHLFLGLLFWQFIIVSESSSVALLITDKNSSIFIKTNTFFSVFYATVSFYLINKIGIYSIVYSVVIGQLINLIVYWMKAQSILKMKKL